jgi:hypothetical protein
LVLPTSSTATASGFDEPRAMVAGVYSLVAPNATMAGIQLR